jgi:hypothetical protein
MGAKSPTAQPNRTVRPGIFKGQKAGGKNRECEAVGRSGRGTLRSDVTEAPPFGRHRLSGSVAHDDEGKRTGSEGPEEPTGVRTGKLLGATGFFGGLSAMPITSPILDGIGVGSQCLSGWH